MNYIVECEDKSDSSVVWFIYFKDTFIEGIKVPKYLKIINIVRDYNTKGLDSW